MQARPIKRAEFERPLLVLLSAVFVASLQFAYANMDSQLFGFLGLHWKSLTPFWTAVGFTMAVLPSLWMPVRLTRPSQVAYWILYLTVIVPVMWVPFHTLNTPPEDYLPFSIPFLGCFFVLGLTSRLPRWKIARPDIKSETFFFLVTALVTVFTLAVWSTNGFRFDLGLKGIYDRRRSSGESIPMGSVLSYVKGNLGSALQPYSFAVGLARGSAVLVGLSLFAGIVGFSVDGSKTSAAIPLFLLALYPLITKFRARFGPIVVVMGIVGVVGAYCAWAVTRNVGVPVISTWRLFDVKGLLTGYYWEFFSTHPKTLLSDGILRGFFANPYNYAAPEQIGLVYFGSSDTNSNANLWASAFGDFGYFGMALVTALLAMIFRLIDSMSLNRGFLIPAFLASFLGMKLSDVALDTSILSHGTLAILILIYVLPPLQRKSPDSSPVTHPEVSLA